MKNKALAKKYKGEDLAFAKSVRNKIKAGKEGFPRWTAERKKVAFTRRDGTQYARTVTNVFCVIDVMVNARGL